jgi:hypothetical protein
MLAHPANAQAVHGNAGRLGNYQSQLKKCKETLSGYPLRMIEGVEPDAIKVASPVLNGGDEETGLCRPRLVATQLHSPTGMPTLTHLA